METDAAREFFLERKYARFGETLNVSEKGLIQGYASLFGQADHSGDIVQPGAYALTLRALDEVGQRVKMLWQHDPTQPIGLSIGYRTKKAVKDGKGQRLLTELELWEVSLVTFPMLPSARVSSKGEDPAAEIWRDLAAAFDGARLQLARS